KAESPRSGSVSALPFRGHCAPSANWRFMSANTAGSLKLGSRRLVHAGAASQPVDANEVVGVVVRRSHHDVSGAVPPGGVLEEDAALRQRDEFVSSRSQLAVSIEGNIR